MQMIGVLALCSLLHKWKVKFWYKTIDENNSLKYNKISVSVLFFN